MRLESIKYSEFEEQPNKWQLDEFIVSPVNLIVGKNASGKTRTLALINNLAKLLRGEIKPIFKSANFDARFSHEGKNYRYVIRIINGAVESENFEIDTIERLARKQDGSGKIYAQQLQQDMVFQTPVSELALTARRDSIQHPYFEPLFEWASSVYHYAFGTPLGRDTFGLLREGASEPDPKDTTSVVNIYHQGEKKFGDSFKQAIKKDMQSIGYDISDIGLANPPSLITLVGTAPGELVGIWVQECELKGKTEQENMSQGMFRALSLIIQLNYSIMVHKPTCVLIDDIGEGLDFERSCSIIELLLTKVKKSNTQLIMATNDRFVMNKVPLEMWTILHRQNSDCKVFNIKNSTDVFENFRFTGLNNFDFFATDYFAESKK